MIGKRDENRVPVSMGVSSVDGVTPITLRVDPITGRLLCQMTALTGDAALDSPAKRDENRVPIMMGMTTIPVSLKVSANGGLMIQST